MEHADQDQVSRFYRISAFRLLLAAVVALIACEGAQGGNTPHTQGGSYPDPIGVTTSDLAVWQNSMVSGDLSSPQWQPWQYLGNTKPSVQPFSGSDLNGGYQGAIVNAGLGANNDLVFAFCSPGTGFNIAVDAGTISGAATFNWVLWDETSTTTPTNVSAAVTVTTASPTLSTYTNTYTGLTVGRVYFAGFRFNTGSQGSFMFANPRVAPTGVVSTSIFNGNFQRIDIRPDYLYGNHFLTNYSFRNLRVFSPHAPHSEMRLATNASKVAVELFNPYGAYALPWGNTCFRVNGNPYAHSAVNNNYGSLIEQSLPSTTTQVDTIVGDNAIMVSTQPTFPEMPYLAALYVPAGALVSTAPRPTGLRLIELGDSMTAGVGSTTSCFDSYAALAKTTWPGEVYIDGEQGRALYNDANTAAEVSATTARLAAVNPTHINILLGYNDWANNQTTAMFSTEVTNLSNALIAALPNTQIRWILPIISGAEATTNGTTSLTLGQIRQVERAAVLALNKANVTTLDGTEMMPIGQLYSMDHIHPGPQGHATLWSNISSAMFTSQGAGYSGAGPFDPTSIPNFAAEWKPEYGFSAGSWIDYSSSAFTATQATGSNQPTMTSTGGPNGLPAVNFASASSQSLAMSSTPITNQNFTVFLVGKFASTSTSMFFADFGNTDTGEGMGLASDFFGDSKREIVHGGVSGETSFGSSTTSWEAWTVQRDTATITTRVNGAAVALTGTSNLIAFNAKLLIGARGGASPSAFLNGSIRRILAYTRVLTTGEVNTVEAAERAESAIW